jgi:aminoglycoside phosphotransferase (APT) family kinase protein
LSAQPASIDAALARRLLASQSLDGDTAEPVRIADLSAFAIGLAQFLLQLQHIAPDGGPAPGPDNFHRGGALSVYGTETRSAIAALADRIDADAANQVWARALSSTWTGRPVWVHGDLSAGNLLVSGGKLCAVIDFGQLCVGDPACDLAIAWTLFNGASRTAFRTALALDAATWARARGWALWKAAIVAAGADTRAAEAAHCWRTLGEVLADR